MCHSRAADGFNESFLDDTLLNVKGKLASSLLRSAPTNSVSKSGNVGNLFSLHPKSFFGNRSRTVLGAFLNAAHVVNFMAGQVLVVFSTHNFDLL